MKNWWNQLGTIWKVVIIAALLIIGVIIYDRVSEAWSDYKGGQYEERYQQREAENKKLEEENIKLRERNAQIDKQLTDLELKNQVLESSKINLDKKQQEEITKLDEALAAQDAEEARTAQPTDARTRCERTKQKMIELGSKTAMEINCNENRQ